MGACFSTHSEQLLPPSAMVVSVNGALHPYPLPVLASHVLQAEAAAASSSSSSTSVFLCNSDLLSYDDYIPALDSSAPLSPSQLYFVLPKSKLHNKLSASDMAALAVKASLALGLHNSHAPRRNKSRISPILSVPPPSSQPPLTNLHTKPFTSQHPQPPAAFSRSASVRKLHRYTSRRAKLAVRSFRLRLSTIYEGTVL